MEKAFAYYRYSSHNQDDGNSINAQQQAVRQFAKENKIKIVNEYTDKAKTGTNTNREGYQKMLADLDKHTEVKTILVHVLDRLHRNTREQLNMIYELKSKGIRILTVSGLDTSNEDDMSVILDEACQAEKYSRRLSKETRKGLMVNAQKGLHNGGRPPYGFKVGKDKRLEEDHETSPAVRKIFDMYGAGMSYSHIIAWLNKNGYMSVNGGEFAKTTIKEMLSNQKYIGTYIWDRKSAKDYRGKHNSHIEKDEYIKIEDAVPALVDKDIFEKVQKRLRSNQSKVGSHNGKNYYPMNGRIVCKKCGKPFRGMVQYSRTNKDGIPQTLYKTQCTCHNKKTVNQKYLDDMIIFALRECIFSPQNTAELLKRLNEYADTMTSENDIQLSICQEELEDLKCKQQNLIDVMAKGLYTDSVIQRLQTIEGRIKETESKIQELSEQKKAFTLDDLTAIRKAFVPFVRDVCCEENLTMLDDTISKVSIDDEIAVKFKENITVDKDTKRNFN